MLFAEFKKRYRRLPVIPASQIFLPGQPVQAVRNQLSQWRKKGWLVSLRRGLYMLPADERSVNPSLVYLANQLYPPSYVSLEYALGYYGLIPEAVAQITSVTSRKTMKFRNQAGVFGYRHLAASLFWGFKGVKDGNGYQTLMAGPEKALLDFLYFQKNNLPQDDKLCREMFANSFRFQNTAMLNRKKLAEYAGRFDSKTAAAAARFLKFMRR